MNNFQSEPHDDMADDAELLRALGPRKPQLDWQAIVAELPEESLSTTKTSLQLSSVPQTRMLHRLATSWWSGALAGSLITLGVLSSFGSLNQAERSEPVDSVAKVENSNFDINSQPPSLANNNTPTETRIEGLQADLIADDVAESLMNRHGMSSRMVSSSAIPTSWRASPFDSSESSAQPPSQSALRKMLLEVN